MTKLVYILPTYDPSTEKHYYYEYELLKTLDEKTDLRVIVEDGEAMPLDGSVVQRFRSPPLRALELLIRLLVLRLQGYDTTYTHYSYYGGILTGLLSSLLGGTALYWHCEEMERTIQSDLPPSERLRSKLRAQLPFRLSLRLADVLVTGTETMCDHYRNAYGLPEKTVEPLPNWVDVERFDALPERPEAREQLDIPADRPVVLYLHKVSPKKGADNIPDIAARVVDEVPSALFVVVGGSDYRHELAADVADAGLGNSVEIVGPVPNEQAVTYFRAADVFMLPSRAEGFPRVLVEAMAAGCPFVSTDVGGIREIAPPVAEPYVVPYGDWEAFAGGIVALLQNEDRAEAFATEGRAHVTQYSREAVVDRLLEILDHD